MKQLRVRNQQRARSINGAFVRRITRDLLEGKLGLQNYALFIHFVSAARMAEINQHYLHHEGSTDVITFDYKEGYEEVQGEMLDLSGEIFISVEDAVQQAAGFKTTWKEELLRYIIHAILHLLGHDDLTPGKRKVMKKEENRLLRELSRRTDLRKIGQ
jgi:probable rRNA maturation factor